MSGGPPRRTLAALVEYDGTDFFGWARQPGRRTVEGEVARALETVLRHPVRLTVAGRTDAGVHASGQVVSFASGAGMEPDEVAYRATAVLPKDVALRRCVLAPEGFDARRDARSRSYSYRLVNAPTRPVLERRYAAYVARPLDLGLLREASDLLRGTHDFTAFTPTKSYHARFTREVRESRWEREGEVLTYRVTADSFMYGMVRALVGTMVEVSDGSRSLDAFAELLAGGERRDSGPSAPARGLTLVGVEYAELNLQTSGRYT